MRSIRLGFALAALLGFGLAAGQAQPPFAKGGGKAPGRGPSPGEMVVVQGPPCTIPPPHVKHLSTCGP
jgi:hypothetical protein